MSKKRILSSIFAIALMAVVGMGISKNVNSNENLSKLALGNIEALALINGEDGSDEFNCSLGKDECKITVTAQIAPKLKEKFNITVTVGFTVDLTDFTKVYSAPLPNKPRVRCGTDVFCNDLL